MVKALRGFGIAHAVQPKQGDTVVRGPDFAGGADGGAGKRGQVVQIDHGTMPFLVRWEATEQEEWCYPCTEDRCQLLVVESADGSEDLSARLHLPISLVEREVLDAVAATLVE
eukprot:RCo011567